jgi:hypothetical protein
MNDYVNYMRGRDQYSRAFGYVPQGGNSGMSISMLPTASDPGFQNRIDTGYEAFLNNKLAQRMREAEIKEAEGRAAAWGRFGQMPDFFIQTQAQQYAAPQFQAPQYQQPTNPYQRQSGSNAMQMPGNALNRMFK